MQPLDTFLQNCTGSDGTTSSEDSNLSLLNRILIFLCHYFSSSRQFQTRALSFCKLPAPPDFLFIIYSFVLIANKNTKSIRCQACKILLNKSSHSDIKLSCKLSSIILSPDLHIPDLHIPDHRQMYIVYILLS